MRRFWIKPEVKALRTLYPHAQTRDVALILGRTERSVWLKAQQIGIHKSKAFRQSVLSGHLLKGSTRGAAYRFKPGHATWNKGMKGLHIGGKETQFRKGNTPKNHRPIGSERMTKDGHTEVKVAEPNVWKVKHRVLWEKRRGPVPRGSILRFKRLSDGVKLSNLEVVSRAENMRRNAYQRYPKPLALAIQLRGALNRQINKRAKHENY